MSLARVTTDTLRLVTDMTSLTSERPVAELPGAVRFDLIAAQELSAPLRARWNAVRCQRPELRSPFFSPDFVASVAAVIPDIEIGIASQAGEVVAIFPFQRHRGTTARPVGVGINDAHGLISLPNSSVSLLEMMSACSLTSFPFHAAPPELPDIAEYELGTTRSFLADLTVDPLGYENFLRRTSQTVDKQAQKTRRMIRELGPLRFEFDCREPALLQRLIDLKCEQYERTHIFNILGVPWIQQLLRNLHERPPESVRGILNVLYAGDKPVALHFGMLEGDLLHYWFPVFDRAASCGSPGTQLFLEIAREGAAQGMTAIDMGYGEQAYKTKLTNVAGEMSYGLVDENPLRRTWYRQKKLLTERLKRLRFKQAIKPWARKLLPGFGRGTYEA